MKGIVFNLLEQSVVADHGEDVWEELLDVSCLDGVYTSLGSYPDEDLFALVGAAASVLEVRSDDVVRWFGQRSLPLFAERYPQLFSRHVDARSFVLTLNEIIHPEVRKLYPGAIVPEFGFDTSDADWLGMDYYSPRKLCAFAEGLLIGAGEHYGQTVTIDQPQCMNRGDRECRMNIRFSRTR
ncbi:heme NO-binding domain-containing protein [Conexibacter sp. DBS9H8]|uniref:heme NO-binding domain-containing protein n=1 Tax=Conexibacter sp. DBS9H8 TaxID=2937801 RepID=UPI00200E1FF2|nr:heme NO-binding domain-containing protein [Conexibacter sp. DBS9H8]